MSHGSIVKPAVCVAATVVRRASWIVLLLIAPLIGACSRVVSVEPLAADLPPSLQNWAGAYTGELDSDKQGKMAMLLQLKQRGDGTYDFTLHSRGPGRDLFAPGDVLDLMGRGEVRLIDVGDGLAAAQTRCEIGFVLRPDAPPQSRTLSDMVDVARRFGETSKSVPHSNYLGPYVYTFVRGTPAHAETALAVSGETIVSEAAAGTSIDVDKWENGVGDGLLIGAGMIFENDDVHIANHGAPAEARTFFAHLAQKVFANEDAKNGIVWTRVAPERLSALRFSDRYPGPGRLPGWCNIMAGVPNK